MSESNAARAAQQHAARKGALDVVSATAGYRYEVQVHPRSGPLGRWRGRIVTTDGTGKRHHRRWHRSFSRDRLIAILWEEAMRDIQWRTGGASTVEIVEFM